MNENVIPFRKQKPPRKPRPTKLLVVLAIVAFFIAAWAYFYLVGQPHPAQ